MSCGLLMVAFLKGTVADHGGRNGAAGDAGACAAVVPGSGKVAAVAAAPAAAAAAAAAGGLRYGETRSDHHQEEGGHGGHHGGAWKVAYADFVTAMMALFIVLWLMNSSKQVQEAVGGYFKDPTGTSKKVGSNMQGSGENFTLTKDNMPKAERGAAEGDAADVGFREAEEPDRDDGYGRRAAD